MNANENIISIIQEWNKKEAPGAIVRFNVIYFNNIQKNINNKKIRTRIL